jgi:hypothetical protein
MDDGDLVEIVRNIHLGSLRWPNRASEAGEAHNRLYTDFRGFSWKDTTSVLQQEEAIVNRIAQTVSSPVGGADDRDFDNEVTEEEWEDWGQDIGVASVVIALSAARCLPMTSCNGGKGHLEAHPLVVFWCRSVHIPHLMRSAEEADCGLVNSTDGTLMVYANKVHNMLAFARCLINRKSTFRNLRFRDASLPRKSRLVSRNNEAQQLDRPSLL